MSPLVLAPLPAVAVLVFVMIGVMPWPGLSAVFTNFLADRLPMFAGVGAPATAMALALLPISGIYFWSLRRPWLMPAVAVFGCGVILDVLTQGPLGVWAVSALVAALLGRRARRTRPDAPWPQRIAQVATALAASAAAASVIMMLYQQDFAALQPFILAVPLACLAYPIVAALLSLLDRLWPVAMSRSLFLRGD